MAAAGADDPFKDATAALRRLRLALRAEDRAGERAALADVLEASRDCPPLFRKALATFTAAGASERLLAGLRERPDLTFSRLFLIAAAMKLAGPERWRAEMAPDLHSALKRDPQLVRFNETDYLQIYAKSLHEELIAELSRIKWRDWPRNDGRPLLAVAAREGWRAKPSVALADFFYDRSRAPQADRYAWDKEVAGACVADHFLSDGRAISGVKHVDDFFPEAYYELLVDEAAARPVFDGIREGGPMVLSTFHGSFFAAVLNAYTRHLEQGVRVISANSLESTEFRITTGPDRPNSAFLMLKALGKKRVVLIASDGPQGAQKIEREVLGVPLTFSTGTAFVAHEAGCATGWYSLERDEDWTRPAFRPGPRKAPREKLADYVERWFDFFVREVEAALTGDPGSLPLRGAVVNNISRHIYRNVR